MTPRIQPFELGFLAARKLRQQPNPFKPGTDESQEWELGFAQGRSDDEYTIDELAQVEGVDRSTIKRYMIGKPGGYLPHHRKYKCRVFYRQELVNAMRKHGTF